MSDMQSSDLQRRFKTTTVYKRSKPYFDISRLNRLQQQEELSRRKPSEVNNQTLSAKFSESFYSAEAKLNQRVHTQLSRFQTKGSLQDIYQTETDYTVSTRKGKSVDMNKMLPRTYFEKNRKVSQNQTNFCNFKPYILPHNNCVNFEKYLSTQGKFKNSQHKSKNRNCRRCKSREGSTFQEIPTITPPEIGKTKEKLLFDQSLFKTFVDFKKYDKQNSQRLEPKTEVTQNLQNIRLGEEMTQKAPKLGLIEFYHGNHKWTAPQMDNRLTKFNEYCLKAYNKEQQKKLDFTMLKRKTDLIEARKLKIMARKKIKDVRGQICDEQFFRRNFL